MPSYDVILVGTGFASSFFLYEYLKKADKNARLLILERGPAAAHNWQLKNLRNSPINHEDTFIQRSQGEKSWNFTVAFGGSSNAWWAGTPRMLPNDFRLWSTYGVGRDWPLSYDALEHYYCEAETIMDVSGPNDFAFLAPRSQPYPQPPHRFTDPDFLLKKTHPDSFYQQPTARARRATRNSLACCANAVCDLCPIDAKFTIHNGLAPIYEDPRVDLLLEAEALSIETTAGVATGVVYRHAGMIQKANGDLVALGANSIFNPYLLMRSGLDHPLLGRRLHEQVSVEVLVYLDGVDNFQGSTSVTGLGFMFYDGPYRNNYAGCMIETWNKPMIRIEFGKWRQILQLRVVFEDLPLVANRVYVSDDLPSKPVVSFQRRSEYALAGINTLEERLAQVLQGLPVERVEISHEPSLTESHSLGTTVMGNSPTSSIVDRHLIHHQVRNLLVLGGSVFPTGPPANPTLTISALSLYAARHLMS